MLGSDYESRKDYEKEGDFKEERRKEKKVDNEIVWYESKQWEKRDQQKPGRGAVWLAVGEGHN